MKCFFEVNNNGCVEKDSIFIQVRDYKCDLSKIDIPNAFFSKWGPDK